MTSSSREPSPTSTDALEGEMIGRVADALCLADNPHRGPNGCRECQLDFSLGQSEIRLNCVGYFGAQAHAAIEAMLEPTEAMLKAHHLYGVSSDPRDDWQNMITAALSSASPNAGESSRDEPFPPPTKDVEP